MAAPKKPRSSTALGPDGLTIKQRKFVNEFPLATSQTDAAIKAGYSPIVAAEVGSQNLRNSKIAAALSAQNEAATSEAVMSLLKRKERLSKLALPDPEHPDPIKAIDTLNRMERVYGDPADAAKGTSVIVLVVTGFGGGDEEAEGSVRLVGAKGDGD